MTWFRSPWKEGLLRIHGAEQHHHHQPADRSVEGECNRKSLFASRVVVVLERVYLVTAAEDDPSPISSANRTVKQESFRWSAD